MERRHQKFSRAFEATFLAAWMLVLGMAGSLVLSHALGRYLSQDLVMGAWLPLVAVSGVFVSRVLIARKETG